ncbi:MAG TPA: septum formation initiator family protein [Bacillota bacterium]|nr:septum formation initiator family protein [Bacillota bacterium]
MSMKQTVTKLESNYMEQYEAHMKRQQRRRKKLVRRLVTASIITAIIVGFLTSYHVNQRLLYAKKANEYEQMQAELETLKSEQVALEEEIELLNNDDYVLEIARSNYFYSKKGELLFKLPDKGASN